MPRDEYKIIGGPGMGYKEFVILDSLTGSQVTISGFQERQSEKRTVNEKGMGIPSYNYSTCPLLRSESRILNSQPKHDSQFYKSYFEIGNLLKNVINK